MKRWLIACIAAGLIAGCAARNTDIPDRDVYVPLSNGMIVRIPKGHLNPENKDRSWKDEEGYRRWLEEQAARQKEQGGKERFRSLSFSLG